MNQKTKTTKRPFYTYGDPDLEKVKQATNPHKYAHLLFNAELYHRNKTIYTDYELVCFAHQNHSEPEKDYAIPRENLINVYHHTFGNEAILKMYSENVECVFDYDAVSIQLEETEPAPVKIIEIHYRDKETDEIKVIADWENTLKMYTAYCDDREIWNDNIK